MAKKRKTRIPRVTKRQHRMSGGPFNGMILYLSCGGTLPMRVGKYVGHYNYNDVWVEA